MRDQGYTDEEVERKAKALRERLERESGALTTTGKGGGRGRYVCTSAVSGGWLSPCDHHLPSPYLAPPAAFHAHSRMPTRLLPPSHGSGGSSSGNAQLTDTHEVAARKAEEVERLREAFGISKDHQEGETWDPEAQARRKAEREQARKVGT